MIIYIIIYAILLAVSLFHSISSFYSDNFVAGMGWLSASLWIINLILIQCRDYLNKHR